VQEDERGSGTAAMLSESVHDARILLPAGQRRGLVIVGRVPRVDDPYANEWSGSSAGR
jgi:hypothetical protein